MDAIPFSTQTPLLVSGGVILLTVAITYIGQWYRGFHHIRRIPGFKDWPIVGDCLHIEREPTAFYQQLIGLLEQNRKYGIMRFTAGYKAVVCLFEPESVEKLLRSPLYIEKSDEYDIMMPWLGTGLLTSTGSKWKTRRRLLTPSFHFNILKEFLHVMNSHALCLKERLEEISSTGEAFNMFVPITLNALDVICETAMGINMDALHDEDSEYVKAVYFVKNSMAIRQRTPWYWPDIIYNNLPIGKRVQQGIKLLHELAFKVIRERRQLHSDGDFGEKHKAFLDTLLDAKDETGQLLTDEDIREEVDTFMFEGHDTVSAALGHAVHLLGANPEHQRRCQEELDSIFDGPREITSNDLSKMNYLEWCIKEALRLYPSVPMVGRALPEDTEFNGYLVPKGTTAGVLAMSLHRDPKIYPDPEKFDPLRFSPEQAAGRHPYAYVPFSAGPRNCIGLRFAMMEMKVTLATILRNFSIKSTQTRQEVRTNPGLVLQPDAGIWVKLSTRH